MTDRYYRPPGFPSPIGHPWPPPAAATAAHRGSRLPAARIVGIIGVVIALVTSLLLTAQTRPPTGLPTIGVVDYLAPSGHREFLAGDRQVVVETSLLPGGVAFNDAPTHFQQVFEIIEQGASIYWLTEQVADPHGAARTELLSITASGLSLHAVTSAEANYYLDGIGVLALPPEPAAGDQWSGQATAISADGTEQLAFSRQASVSAATGQPGCLTISYADQLGDQTSHSAVTRCPGRGITGLASDQLGDLVAGPGWSRDASGLLASTPAPFALVEAPQPLALQAGMITLSVGTTTAPVALGDGLLVPNRTNGHLVFALVDGDSTWDVQWRQRPGEATLALLGAGEVAVAATTDRQLVAYDASGRLLWQHETPDLVAHLVRVGDDRFAALLLDGTLSVRRLAHGDEEWHGLAPSGGPTAPQALQDANGLVLVAAADRQLGFVRPDDEVRTITLVGAVDALTVVGDQVLVSDSSGTLSAWDATGERRWRSELRDPCDQLEVLGELVVCRTSGELIALGPADGRQVWQQPIATLTITGLDGQLLATGRTITSLLGPDGSVLAQWPINRNSSSVWALQLPAGLLVIGSDAQGDWWPR